jgi:general stress protein 26
MSTVNLTREAAQKKLKELIDTIGTGFLETNLGNKPSHAIPMSRKKVDDDGAIWFLSSKQSEHNKYIDNDNHVQLFYSQTSPKAHVTVFGTASIITNPDMLKELYHSDDDAWFNGLDDPNLTAIKVTPLHAHYWESKDGKIATLFKMSLGAITGNLQEIGVEGNLRP